MSRMPRLAVPITILLVGAQVPAASADPGPWSPRLYRATIETGLPHLEENLRYATTHETLCLGETQLPTAFPLLRHVAFEGCTLGGAQRDGDGIVFRLHCPPGSETTGAAHWRVDGGRLSGTLEAKLGGKNMTLYQRITGHGGGPCVPAP